MPVGGQAVKKKIKKDDNLEFLAFKPCFVFRFLEFSIPTL